MIERATQLDGETVDTVEIRPNGYTKRGDDAAWMAYEIIVRCRSGRVVTFYGDHDAITDVKMGEP